MNKTILMGRLTSDPELRHSQSGVASCKFTIACDRRFANKQTGQREADFISCLAFKNTAEFISRYFTKGKMIAVEGSLRTGSYQDRNHSDVTHYTTDVLVDNVEFCGDKGSGQTEQTPAQNIVNQAQGAGIEAGSLDEYEVISDGAVPF